MRLQIIEEPQLAFHQGKLHIDIRAGISTFGAFDKGSTGVPVPIRIGVIGTTATVDGVRDWLERCKNTMTAIAGAYCLIALTPDSLITMRDPYGIRPLCIGRMNGNGAGNDVNFAHPGPLNEPRTFCAPCPVKAIPRASRSGTVAHKEEVDESLRSIDSPFPKFANCFEPAQL